MEYPVEHKGKSSPSPGTEQSADVSEALDHPDQARPPRRVWKKPVLKMLEMEEQVIAIKEGGMEVTVSAGTGS